MHGAGRVRVKNKEIRVSIFIWCLLFKFEQGFIYKRFIN